MAGLAAASCSFTQAAVGCASDAAFSRRTDVGANNQFLFPTWQSAASESCSVSAVLPVRSHGRRIGVKFRKTLAVSSPPSIPFSLLPFAPFSAFQSPHRSRPNGARRRASCVRASSSSDQLVPSSALMDSADYKVQQGRIDTILARLHELNPGIPSVEEAAIRADLNTLSAESLSLVENSTGKNRNIDSWSDLLKRLIALKEGDDVQRLGRHDHRRVWLAEQRLLKTLGWAARLRETLSRLFSWQGLVLFGAFLLAAVSINLAWRPRAKLVTRPVQYSTFLQEVRHSRRWLLDFSNGSGIQGHQQHAWTGSRS